MRKEWSRRAPAYCYLFITGYGSFDTAQYLKIIPVQNGEVRRERKKGAVLKKRILKCQFGDLCIYIHNSIYTV